jgi:negative regulator of replication initiation
MTYRTSVARITMAPTPTCYKRGQKRSDGECHTFSGKKNVTLCTSYYKKSRSEQQKPTKTADKTKKEEKQDKNIITGVEDTRTVDLCKQMKTKGQRYMIIINVMEDINAKSICQKGPNEPILCM